MNHGAHPGSGDRRASSEAHRLGSHALVPPELQALPRGGPAGRVLRRTDPRGMPRAAGQHRFLQPADDHPHRRRADAARGHLRHRRLRARTRPAGGDGAVRAAAERRDRREDPPVGHPAHFALARRRDGGVARRVPRHSRRLRVRPARDRGGPARRPGVPDQHHREPAQPGRIARDPRSRDPAARGALQSVPARADRPRQPASRTRSCPPSSTSRSSSGSPRRRNGRTCRSASPARRTTSGFSGRRTAPAGPDAHAPGGCLGGKAFAFISHRGKVQICGFLDLEAGDLRRENFDFAKIWKTSPLFAAVRDVDSYRGRCGGVRIPEGLRRMPRARARGHRRLPRRGAVLHAPAARARSGSGRNSIRSTRNFSRRSRRISRSSSGRSRRWPRGSASARRT